MVCTTHWVRQTVAFCKEETKRERHYRRRGRGKWREAERSLYLNRKSKMKDTALFLHLGPTRLPALRGPSSCFSLFNLWRNLPATFDNVVHQLGANHSRVVRQNTGCPVPFELQINKEYF